MPNQQVMQTLQVGMGWFPEQAGNGADRVYHALTKHLPGVGVGVRGLVVGSEEVAASTGGRIRAFAGKEQALPMRLWQERRALRRDGLLAGSDLVAAHFALYALPVLDLVPPRPLVMHFHGPWGYEAQAEGETGLKVKAKTMLERSVYRRADRFVVLSEAFRKVLVERYGVPEEKICIVSGGANMARFDTGLSREEARERLGWPADRPTVLSVRRLVRRVGLENLVEAVQTVKQQVPDVLLLIAGKGPLASSLQAQIEAAGLEKHARLLGFVPDDDLPLAYRAADVSVVPTVALEGFGLIAVESLAAGTPVLVTPVGGLPEVVSDLSEALVLPAATSGALAVGLAAALSGRRELPAAARCQQYARERFDWPVIARQVRAVYEEVL